MPRGGYRPGSGRKAKLKEDQYKRRLVTLPPELDQYLQTMKNASTYIAELIRKDMEQKDKIN